MKLESRETRMATGLNQKSRFQKAPSHQNKEGIEQMQYKNNKKIMIDQRKLETLFRIGCPDNLIIELLKTGKFTPTGDDLIDDNLESLIDYKEFENRGGNHNPSGKNQYSGQNVGQNVGQNDLSKTGQTADKDIDNKKNRFNEDSIIYVNGQYFDEFPPESISTLKKYWSASELEEIRKDLAFKPEHQTTVAQMLLNYPPKPKKKQVEVTNYGEYEYLHSQMDKWIDYKKSRGERYKTEQSLMVCAKKLHELSGGSASVADQIIEQSIANNWAGLFALKQYNNQPKKESFAFTTDSTKSFLNDENGGF